MTRLHPDLVGGKSMTRALVEANGGSETCSSLLDKSASLIRSYANVNRDDRWMPLDDILTLERMAGRAIVTAWAARVAAADPDRPRPALTCADLSAMLLEFPQAKVAVDAAVRARRADGTIPAAERQAAVRELRDVRDLCDRLIEAVEGGE